MRHGKTNYKYCGLQICTKQSTQLPALLSSPKRSANNLLLKSPTAKWVMAVEIQLVRERYRATINRIYQDPENENKYTAEMIIPVTVEGFVVREIALFDRNGNMVLVGNTPEVHKPTLAEGVTQDSVYRIPFVISTIV